MSRTASYLIPAFSFLIACAVMAALTDGGKVSILMTLGAWFGLLIHWVITLR